MPKVKWRPKGSWQRELLVATIWVFIICLGLICIFLLLGGFHGRGGDLLMIATAPIGLLHLLGVGNGAWEAIAALIFQFGSMLATVVMIRAVWRTYTDH